MRISAPATMATGDSTLQTETAFDIDARNSGAPARSVGRGGADARHAPQLAACRQLAFVNSLDAVAHGALDVADVADEPEQAADLHRRRLIAAPHRPVERDMAFDERRTQRHRRPGRRQPDLMSRVSDRALGVLRLEGSNHV